MAEQQEILMALVRVEKLVTFWDTLKDAQMGISSVFESACKLVELKDSRRVEKMEGKFAVDSEFSMVNYQAGMTGDPMVHCAADQKDTLKAGKRDIVTVASRVACRAYNLDSALVVWKDFCLVYLQVEWRGSWMDLYLLVGMMADFSVEAMGTEKVKHQAEQQVDAVVEQLALWKASKLAYLKVYVSVAVWDVGLVDMLAHEKEFDWVVTTAMYLARMLVLLQELSLVAQMAQLMDLLWVALKGIVPVASKDQQMVYFQVFLQV